MLDDIRDYLDEHKSAKENEDRVLLAKLEELQTAIRNGLSQFPQEPRLLTVEAEYYKILENERQALQLLKRAFERNKRLDWIAVRLSSVYRRREERSEAISVLKQSVEANPASKDANFALGRLLADSDNEIERASALEILRRSFTRGDSNFTAQLWYARELFLAERFDEADGIFSTLKRVHISSDVKRTITAVLRNEAGKAKNFLGVVAKKEEGFIFVSFDDFAKDLFVFRGEVSKDDWAKLSAGTRVVGEIGFTFMGPCGSQLKIA